MVGNGGAVTIYKNDTAKLIKSINQNIVWSTSRFEGALVHFITVYIPPENKPIADLTLRQISWILYRIFEMDKDSKIVVAGDFNQIGMKRCQFIEDKFKLTPVIPDN